MTRVIAVSFDGYTSALGFASVDLFASYGRGRRVPLGEQRNQSAPNQAVDPSIKS